MSKPDLSNAGESFPVIRTKSVYSPIEPDYDGLRILATRFRGKGLPKSRYHVWMANLGPSEKLLKDVRAETISCTEFKGRYRAELFEGGSIDKRCPNIKNYGQKFTLRLLQQLAKLRPVTVMCHCHEDQLHCHWYLLQAILRQKHLGAK
jgi:uncharacterized protein YeaO (DUF488 family)